MEIQKFLCDFDKGKHFSEKEARSIFNNDLVFLYESITREATFDTYVIQTYVFSVYNRLFAFKYKSAIKDIDGFDKLESDIYECFIRTEQKTITEYVDIKEAQKISKIPICPHCGGRIMYEISDSISISGYISDDMEEATTEINERDGQFSEGFSLFCEDCGRHFQEDEICGLKTEKMYK